MGEEVRSGFDEREQLFVMNANGRRQHRVAPNLYPYSVSWSPDGRQLACECWNGDNYDVYVLDADGSRQLNLTPKHGRRRRRRARVVAGRQVHRVREQGLRSGRLRDSRHSPRRNRSPTTNAQPGLQTAHSAGHPRSGITFVSERTQLRRLRDERRRPEPEKSDEQPGWQTQKSSRRLVADDSRLAPCPPRARAPRSA